MSSIESDITTFLVFLRIFLPALVRTYNAGLRFALLLLLFFFFFFLLLLLFLRTH
jgi:hypothetical protein